MTPELTTTPPPTPALSLQEEKVQHFLRRSRLRARRVAAIAAVLGLLGKLLFIGPRLGLAVPLFFALVVAGLWTVAEDEGWRRGGAARWLLLPAGFFAAMVAVRDSALLTALNVALVFGLTALAAQRFDGAAPLTTSSGAQLISDALAGALWSVWRGPEALLRAADGAGLRARAARYTWPAVRAVLLTGPLLLVFGGLLAWGDDGFGEAVADVLDGLELEGVLSGAVVVAAWTLVLAGGFRHALRPSDTTAPAAPGTAGPLRFSDAAIPLGALSLLFFTFGAVRLSAVLRFDKFAAAARPEFTYAREVHQSFGALMVVVVLTLGVLLAFSRFTRLDDARQRLGFTAVGTTLVVLTTPILLTGLSRLVLYERMYGFTEQRLVATWLVLLAAALLAARAVTLWAGAQRFGFAALAVGVAFCAALNLLNPDATIARANLERPKGVVQLDEAHLLSLSADAAPLVLEHFERQGRHDEAAAYRQRVAQAPGFTAWRWARAAVPPPPSP